jgi:hypothetical protein
VAELAPVRFGAFNRARDRVSRRVRCLLFSIGERRADPVHRIDADRQRELEGRFDLVDPTLLSSSPNVLRTIRAGAIWDENRKAATYGRRAERKSITSMPTDKIRPSSHLKIKFQIPRNRVIRYEVEASRPVDTYILDEKGLQEFYSKSNSIESYYGGFSNRYNHQQELRLPFGGWAYLVIKNNQSESVAVHYEVSA